MLLETLRKTAWINSLEMVDRLIKFIVHKLVEELMKELIKNKETTETDPVGCFSHILQIYRYDPKNADLNFLPNPEDFPVILFSNGFLPFSICWDLKSMLSDFEEHFKRGYWASISLSKKNIRRIKCH